MDRITNGDTPTDRLPENQTTQGEGSVMSFGVADDMSEEQALALLQSVYIVFMNTDSGEVKLQVMGYEPKTYYSAGTVALQTTLTMP